MDNENKNQEQVNSVDIPVVPEVAPVETPVAPEVAAPVETPVAPEVAAPVEALVAPEVATPVEAPVAPEVAAPVETPAMPQTPDLSQDTLNTPAELTPEQPVQAASEQKNEKDDLEKRNNDGIKFLVVLAILVLIFIIVMPLLFRFF